MWKATKSLKDARGQAMVEYLVMLIVAVLVVSAVAQSFKGALLGLWGYYIQNISAGCPTGCPAHSNYRF